MQRIDDRFTAEDDPANDEWEGTPELGEPEHRDAERRARHRDGSGAALRIDPGRPAAAVLCLVAVLSAALAAGLTWISRPSLDPVTPPPQVLTPGSVLDSAPPTAATGAPSEPAEIVVSVIGQVGAPGLVQLPAGSRVNDAITAAGGLLPDADVSTVNLARVLVDGEQVAVGVPGAQAPGGGAPATGGDPAAGGGLVNLNSATETELQELPGIGPVLSARIVEWREANGGFSSVGDLNDVDGIGPATFERLRDEVTV